MTQANKFDNNGQKRKEIPMLGPLPMDEIAHKLQLDTKLTKSYKELKNKINFPNLPCK